MNKKDMLVRQARAVLDFNWTGEYTMPVPRLYPHQWSWDSAFIFADRAYDETKIRQDCPFLVQDVLFNPLLLKADKDLAEIARIVGEDPAPHEDLAKKTKSAVQKKL
jgi:hypothetical protein